jgi:nitrite reductase/ring-hydroxylating ferredoxin subunit
VKIRVEGGGKLPPGEALTFSFEADGETIHGFVLRVVTPEFDGLVAYQNRCAHLGFDLDMGTGRFWSSKLGRIYCMTHGACFRPQDGLCDAGPCLGQWLQQYDVAADGEDAVVEIRDC